MGYFQKTIKPPAFLQAAYGLDYKNAMIKNIKGFMAAP